MESYLSKNITTTTTTAVCLTGCILHSIIINEKANGYIEFRDGSTSLGQIKANVDEGVFKYDIVINDALNVVTDTAVGDITVTYSLQGS